MMPVPFSNLLIKMLCWSWGRSDMLCLNFFEAFLDSADTRLPLIRRMRLCVAPASLSLGLTSVVHIACASWHLSINHWMLVDGEGLKLLLVAKIDVMGLLSHLMSKGQVALGRPDRALISFCAWLCHLVQSESRLAELLASGFLMHPLVSA